MNALTSNYPITTPEASVTDYSVLLTRSCEHPPAGADVPTEHAMSPFSLAFGLCSDYIGSFTFQDQRAAQMRALRGLFAVTLSAEYARHRVDRGRPLSFAHEELFHDFFDQVVVDVHQTSWLVK